MNASWTALNQILMCGRGWLLLAKPENQQTSLWTEWPISSEGPNPFYGIPVEGDTYVISPPFLS